MKKILLSAIALLGIAGTAFAGNGTKENPYTPEEVMALTADQTGVYVKGYIVGSATGASWKDSFSTSTIGASQSNIGLADSSSEDKAEYVMPVALVANTDTRNALQLSSHPENIRHQVIIYGDATKYFGIMGIKNTSSYEWVGTPPDPSEAPKGPEFPSEVMTVAQALELMAQGVTGQAQVKGYISEITELSTQYGNATYSLVDDLSVAGQSLLVYRGYYLNGDKFTAENQLARGAYVVVSGELVIYNGTYEFTTGSKIESYTDPSGDVPDVPTPDKPSGESVTFDFTNPGTYISGFSSDATEYDVTDLSFTQSPISISIKKLEGASNNPRFFKASSGIWDLRFYKDNTITISAAEGYLISGIEFSQSNLNNQSITWSNGSFNNNAWTPTDGKAIKSLVLGKNATGSNPSIKTMRVYYCTEAGVDEVLAADDSKAVYFNLQGQKVANPDRGIFIKVVGNKAVKVVK